MEEPDVKVTLSGDKVLVIPTSREGGEIHAKKSMGHGTRRKAPYVTCSCRPIQTKNYLMKGGQRALDRDLQERWDAYKESTITDLVVANEALAKELVRLQTEMKNMQSQVDQDKEVLTAELTAKREQEVALKEALKMCDERIKELHKKMREERSARTQAEACYQETLSQLQSFEEKNTSMASTLEIREKNLQKQNEQVEKMSNELKEAREKLKHKDSRLKECSKELREATKCQAETQERGQVLEGTVQALTQRATRLQKECQTLRHKTTQQSETCTKLKDQLQQNEKQIELNEVQQTSLQQEIHSLRDLLGTERSAAAKHQNEAKQLSKELEASHRSQASLQGSQDRLQSEIHDLKAAIKIERDSNRDLTKHCSKVKEKLETAIQEHKKRESDWSVDTKAKLESIKHDIRKKENGYLSELRSYKQSLKDTQAELESLTETHVNDRREKEALQTRCSSLKQSLVAAQDKNKRLQFDLDDSAQELRRAKDQLSYQEERWTQSAASHTERLNEVEQDLQREAIQCVQLREKIATLNAKLETDAAEVQRGKEESSCALRERDAQIHQLGESVKSLSSNLRVAQETHNQQKDNYKAQAAQWHGEKAQLMEEVSGLKKRIEDGANEGALFKDELSRLSRLLTEKEAELQLMQKQRTTHETQTTSALRETEETVAQLKKQVEEKDQVISDVLGAMHAEESTRKTVQKSLEATIQRNRELETQLATSHSALERAVSDAASTKEAFAAMREKADALKSENAELMNQYDTWAAKVVQESQESKRGSFKAAGNAILAKQRMESGNYSERLATLMQRRQSTRMP